MNPKQNLTNYSDNELSLLVMNDEGLYRMRRNKDLKELLSEYFIFSEPQWDVLEQDLRDERARVANE